MNVYLDLDGVCTNFLKGCQQVFPWPNHPIQTGQEISEFLGLSKKEFWSEIDQYGESWWRNLEETPWFWSLIKVVEQYDKNWKFLTSPSRSHFAASGKILWMQDRFGHNFNRFHLTPAKNKCDLSNRQSVLIDDNERNCEEFRKKLGYSILFPDIGNKNHEICYKNVQFVKEELELISKFV